MKKNNDYFRLFNHYTNLALNTYRWVNLPEGLESKYIEKALYKHGQCFFTWDKDFGYMCLPCSPSGQINIYGEPLGYVLTGVGYSKQVKDDQGVRITNNDTAVPTVWHIDYYTKKMVEVDEVILQNLRQQRFPYVMATTKNTEFTVKNIAKKIEEKEDFIFMDKSLTDGDGLGIQVIPTLAPYLLDKLQIQKLEFERELLTHLGINTIVEKKERLISVEANANNEHIALNLDLGYKSRKRACELINAKYGLNINVIKVVEEEQKSTYEDDDNFSFNNNIIYEDIVNRDNKGEKKQNE